MDNLELLSNDELRVRLQQYGFQNIPITATTRKTLIKKLRLHLETVNKNLKRTTTNATKYSSGEDSDNTDGVNNNFIGKGGRRSGRITVSGIPSTTSTEMGPPRAITAPRSSTFTRSPINTTSVTPPSKTRGKSSIYVSPVIINDSEDDDLDFSLRKSLSPVVSKSIFSNRSSTTTNYYSSDNSLRNGENEENDEDDDQNSTSEYTKRLLQLRCDTASQKQPLTLRKRTYLGQQPEDIVYQAEAPEPAQMPLNAAIRQFMHRLDENYGFKQTLVPCVLLSFLIIFFLLIIFMYITISPNLENTLNPMTTVYKKCDYSRDMDTTWSCVDEKQLESSLSLLKVLGQELQRLAISSKCDRNPSESSIMCVEDVLAHLAEHQPSGGQMATYNPNTQNIMQDIHSAEYLLAQNPQWGMQNVDEDGLELTLKQIMEKRATNCFTVLKPKLPLTCIIYNKLQAFFVIIGAFALCGVTLYGVWQLVKLVLIAREKRKELVNRLINEIISALLEKMLLDKDNPILVLNHLREKLMDPLKRSEMEWAWVEAIKYLENNDSRIQFEVKNMNGEDFKVIRWIDENKSFNQSSSSNSSQQLQQQQSSPAMNGRSPKKFWMGPAFDKTNKIKDPPTQCLKIRQMFDKYEASDPGLKQVIQDSILNKLAGKNCRIFDVQLDVKTCCVYVKCASNVDAGVLHDEINGFWFDNNLVSIKFLRQERYIQRFPNSANLSTVLRPSKVDYSNGDDDEYEDD